VVSSVPANRLNSLRPAGSLVVLLAAIYAICGDPGSVSKQISSKYRAAFKAAEARVAQFAEPEQVRNSTLWDLLQELIQADQPDIPRPETILEAVALPNPSPVTAPELPALFQRPPPALS
jgi:hypothetical protein